MSGTRLDFKRLRTEADFPAVLASYGIDLKKDGTRAGQFKALCPFHEDTNPSLKVNTEKNVFHCFVCGAKGNVLEFVQAMDGGDLRAAARRLSALAGEAPAPARSAGSRRTSPAPAQSRPVPAPSPAAPETPTDARPAELADGPNPPLSFALKLERDEALLSWLGTRGLTGETLEAFGLGRASAKAKSIAGRLAIPIHNQVGELVAYCGRHVGDLVPDDVPKYVLPKGFRKEQVVFNLHRYRTTPSPHRVAVLFESYFSVMRHHGHVPALSAMGRSFAASQVALLKEAGLAKILVVFDGDEPGRLGAREVAGLLAPHLWVRVVDLPDGVKPHHLAWEELRLLLRAAWQSGPGPAALPD